MTHRPFRALALLLSLAACDTPTPEHFVMHGPVAGPAYDIGSNIAGERCTITRVGTDNPIYCGTYTQPSGHVSLAQDSAEPMDIARAGPWREALERGNRCDPPVSVSIAGAAGASLQCTQRQSAYASVAMAVRLDGRLYLVEAVKPAESVVGQAIGVLSGRIAATPVAALTDTVAGQRQAEQDINLKGVGVIAAIDRQLALGGAYNQSGNYAAAELAYRTAVTLKERLVGSDSASLATPLARQALQLSNQRQFADADRVFARARRLAGSDTGLDPLAAPFVAHMAALDRLNRADYPGALTLLDVAERGYLVVLPPDALDSLAAPRGGGARSPVEQMADMAQTLRANEIPAERDALTGVLEVRRYRAVILARAGRPQEAETELARLRRFNADRDTQLGGRLYRSAATVALGNGQVGDADAALGISVAKFRAAQPGTLPVAETMLLQTGLLQAGSLQTGSPQIGGAGADASLDTCRQATQILLDLNTGVQPALLAPCLRRFALEAAAGGDPAQPWLARMFALSQLVQGSVTAQQIALASARMSESARNPQASAAIRHRDEQNVALERLIRQRQAREAERADAATLTALDEQITAVQQDLQEAERALQASAPGYQQLVQKAVTAEDVLAALHPGETLVSTILAGDDGWTLVLGDGHIVLGRIPGGAAAINRLVARFRAGIDAPSRGGVSAFDTRAAQDLYQAVFGDVAGALEHTGTLIVAPSAVLLSVPFGALLTGPGAVDDLAHAPFLVTRMAVLHVPAPASFLQLRRAAGTSHATRPWFGLGVPNVPSPRQIAASFPAASCGAADVTDVSFAPLPGSAKELEVAGRLALATPSDRLIGRDFTLANIFKARLKEYRILHFATHAVLPGELGCLAEPAIVASATPQDSDAHGALLTASQVAQLDLDADLVILSACNTGGPNGSGAGESLSGLARSFIAAGTRALLVTHWEASDSLTPYLMARFLQRRRDHPEEALALSLASAQRAMLAEATGDDRAFADPRYWAVLALVGGVGT